MKTLTGVAMRKIPVTQNRRVIRVPVATHRAAKLLAAEEDRPLSELAAEALERELERRRRERDKIAVSLATTPPMATRG